MCVRARVQLFESERERGMDRHREQFQIASRTNFLIVLVGSQNIQMTLVPGSYDWLSNMDSCGVFFISIFVWFSPTREAMSSTDAVKNTCQSLNGFALMQKDFCSLCPRITH